MANLGPTTIFGDLNITGSIGGAVRLAFVKTTPTGTDDDVDVYLDVYDTGEEVNDVICLNVDGGYLVNATPTLTQEDPLIVIRIGGAWYCSSLFYAT